MRGDARVRVRYRLERDNHISLFVFCFDIGVSIDDLFQCVASVDDRFELGHVSKFLDEQEILRLFF